MDNRSPFYHTVYKCQRGSNYTDLIFVNDFGQRFVNYHGAAERVSFRKDVPQKFLEDYYQCQKAQIPSGNPLCFELLEEKVYEVASEKHSIFNSGAKSGDQLLAALSLQKLNYQIVSEIALKK